MVEEYDDGVIRGTDGLEDSASEAPPANPARRRLATIFAILFIAVIAAFLIWFIASNTRGTEGGGYFGSDTGRVGDLAAQLLPLRAEVALRG